MINEKVYIYYDTDLPKNGWMQTCTVCDRVTSKTVFYKIVYRYHFISNSSITYLFCFSIRYVVRYFSISFVSN